MPKLIFLLIFSAYTIYFLITPLITTNDEYAHIRIISGVAHGKYLLLKSGKKKPNKELRATKRIEDAIKNFERPYQIPTFSSVSNLKEQKSDYDIYDLYSHEAYSPPFYYLVGALFYYIAKVTPYLLLQFYILRLTSTIFYFGVVFISWKIFTHIFKNRNTASSVLIFFTINPLVLKMGIGINPDIGVTFFSLLFLYFLLKSATTKIKTKNTIILSLVSVLSILTKISGIFTNAVFVLFMFVVFGFRKRTFLQVLLFELIFILLTLPWFSFIINRYGTPFPQPFTYWCIKLGYHSFLSNIFDIFSTFRFTIMEYAGFMGEGWPFPFKWFFVSYVLLYFFFSIIGIRFVFTQTKKMYKILLIYIFPLILLLVSQSTFYRIHQIDCPIQGRYMLPVFLIFNLLIFWGILAITKNEERSALIVRSFAIFQYLFILFTVLLLRYYV